MATVWSEVHQSFVPEIKLPEIPEVKTPKVKPVKVPVQREFAFTVLKGLQPRKNSYVMVTAHGHPRATKEGRVKQHILVAEAARGTFIPAEHPVHHLDEIKYNNAGTNLVICEDRQYHELLHVRAHVLELSGNPDTDKVCTGCKRYFPSTDEYFHRHRGCWDGFQTYCRACRKTYDEKRPPRRGKKTNNDTTIN